MHVIYFFQTMQLTEYLEQIVSDDVIWLGCIELPATNQNGKKQGPLGKTDINMCDKHTHCQIDSNAGVMHDNGKTNRHLNAKKN